MSGVVAMTNPIGYVAFVLIGPPFRLVQTTITPAETKNGPFQNTGL